MGANDPQNGRVIATESEAQKADKARGNWKERGKAVEARIDLREGNILETLEDCPEIDLLLLDIWAPLELPTVKLVERKLRPEAVIITENTLSGAERYKDLSEYLRQPESTFINTTLPYTNGLEMSVYVPSKSNNERLTRLDIGEKRSRRYFLLVLNAPMKTLQREDV